MSDTPHADKFRAALEKIGGWDNSMVGVPAGGVRECIETLAAIEAKLAAAQKALRDILNYPDIRAHIGSLLYDPANDAAKGLDAEGFIKDHIARNRKGA